MPALGATSHRVGAFMRFIAYIGRSIGLTQATAVLVAGLLFGLVSSVIFLSYDLSTRRQSAVTLIEEILTAAEGGATNAAWTLDTDAANQVISGVMALHDVKSATLRDENDAALARASSDSVPPDRLVRWIADLIASGGISGERSLQAPLDGAYRPIGTLTIELDTSRIGRAFLNSALLVLSGGLAQSVSLALVLLWLSSRLVTSPLRQIADAIKRIDPENPQIIEPVLASRHRNNELGYLARRTSDMLGRLVVTQHQLRELATTDPLTGQPNRALITDLLAKALAAAERNECLVAVLFLDLDRFKNINDSLGHDVGDELLIGLAHRLSCTMRRGDSVGRLGGDEFLVVLEDVRAIGEVAHTVRRITSALNEPFDVGNHRIRTSCSIGISVYPGDGKDAGSLMRCADLAMYEAKGSATRWRFFADEMSQRAGSRMAVEVALCAALERDGFRLHYQPKIDARSLELAGCEALLRWRNGPEAIAAAEFIEIAEDSGLIVDIGRWVLEQACQQARKWASRNRPVPVSINVSARQLQEPEFFEQVLACVERCQLKPELIELEITETIMFDALDRSVEGLGRLRDAGIAISIDDFGTGYSSLSYLTRLPVDTLKIDRSFVSGPERSSAVLEMITAMGRALRMKTVAEGVETVAQRDFLASKGCTAFQGYLFSEPLPPERFERIYLGRDVVQSSREMVAE